MKKLQAIENKIIELTSLIEAKYPELYRHLDENPITIPSEKHDEVNLNALEDYLESLSQMLKHHIETHNNK